MGARGSNLFSSFRRRRGTSRIGSPTTCPICGKQFCARSTYNTVNSHIDSCLQSTPIPVSSSLSLRPASEVAHLNFDEKCEWFRAQNDRLRVPWQSCSLTVIVSREQLLEHSRGQLLGMSRSDLRSEFCLVFDGEAAKDAGGVLREWLLQINAQMLAAETGMYRFATTENVSYRVETFAGKDQNYFRMHGIAIGKALFENVPINCRFCKPLFKLLLGRPLEFDDLRYVDHSLYTALKFMQSQNISDIVFETFSVKETNGLTGETREFDLKPNGNSIEVTEENKSEYISLRSEWELTESTKPLWEELVSGFCRVIDQSTLFPFEPEELELMLCGLPFVDVADWEAFTVYKGELHVDHRVVRWFWEVVETFSQEELGLLLQFVMGTTRLPVEGFKSLKTLRGESARFTLEPVLYSREQPYPRAHTCFNRLDLPLYPTKRELHRNLSYVIKNHASGFGIE